MKKTTSIYIQITYKSFETYTRASMYGHMYTCRHTCTHTVGWGRWTKTVKEKGAITEERTSVRQMKWPHTATMSPKTKRETQTLSVLPCERDTGTAPSAGQRRGGRWRWTGCHTGQGMCRIPHYWCMVFWSIRPTPLSPAQHPPVYRHTLKYMYSPFFHGSANTPDNHKIRDRLWTRTPNERIPSWRLPSWKITPRDHLHERPPSKTTLMNGQPERPPSSKTTLRDHLHQRSSWIPLWENTLMNDHPERPPSWNYWKTTLTDHPHEWQPLETTLMNEHSNERPSLFQHCFLLKFPHPYFHTCVYILLCTIHKPLSKDHPSFNATFAWFWGWPLQRAVPLE